ncbi:response regulator [Fimbriiglobus ruber]|nr:response regulator [Fimbriiglobus ruber]
MSNQPIRVAVVDDNEAKRYTIARVLRRAEFEVLEGVVGADAFRLAPAAELIVLDIKLPDMNGYQICRQLKSNPETAHIPILLISATFVGPDSQVEGLESGADAYLTDAAEAPVLVATVRALLRMRQAEELARRGETRVRVALEAGQLGEWNFDPGTNTLNCSTQCKAIYGRGADQPLSYDDLLAAVHADDRAEFATTFSRAVTESVGYDTEYRVVWPDGSTHWVLVRGQVTTVPGVGDRRLIGVALDITDRKRSEEALKDADRKKDEFLALLAHELRNPLAPIRTALHIVRQPGVDAVDVAKARDTMARQLAHMVRLIDDLLDVSRISKGRIELRKERVAVRDILDIAVETSRPLIEAGRHELQIDLPPEPLYIFADLTRIGQVVANLLNNAAKYTPEGGHIRLSVRRATDEADEVVVRVVDNGTGITPEMLPKVWGLFTQSDRTLGRSQGGLGIGLTLVRHLVELHGGAVDARSAGIGMGSEFIVRLPLPPPQEKSTGSSPIPAVPQTSSSVDPHRVLVVDDNVDGAESLATLLSLQNHTVRVAHDGPSALVIAEEFRPDVVLLDIGLPGLDGYEVAHRLRARKEFQHVFLVALTGWGQDSDRERSQAAGFDVHLVKPIDPATLLQVVSRHEG